MQVKRLQRKHCRRYDYLNVWMCTDQRIEFVYEKAAVVDPEVHFPVCDNKFLAHVYKMLMLLVISVQQSLARV